MIGEEGKKEKQLQKTEETIVSPVSWFYQKISEMRDGSSTIVMQFWTTCWSADTSLVHLYSFSFGIGLHRNRIRGHYIMFS